MEEIFCKDKKDFCECLEDCRKCEFAKGNGTIPAYVAHDVLATLFGIDYDLDRIKVVLNQRMTLRDEVAERMQVIGSIDIDRLKELVQAEKEGRVRILPKRTTCGMCANFVQIEGKSGGRCKAKKYRVDRFGIEHKEEGPLIVPKSKTACSKYKEVKK